MNVRMAARKTNATPEITLARPRFSRTNFSRRSRSSSSCCRRARCSSSALALALANGSLGGAKGACCGMIPRAMSAKDGKGVLSGPLGVEALPVGETACPLTSASMKEGLFALRVLIVSEGRLPFRRIAATACAAESLAGTIVDRGDLLRLRRPLLFERRDTDNKRDKRLRTATIVTRERTKMIRRLSLSSNRRLVTR